MITVAEISECFPNEYKPVTGEFILQHAKALSKYCKVIVIVPLRYVPAKEVFSINPFRFISNFYKWQRALNKTRSYTDGNLKVIYFGYFSLPRPYFESKDTGFINTLFYKRLKKLLNSISPDVIYCNWLRPWGELSAKAAKEMKLPFVIDHHEDIPTLKKIFPGNYRTFLETFEKADKIIVHSSVNKADLLNENLKLSEVKTIYLGQNFTINEKQKVFNPGKIKLVCVSHLSEPRKNIDILIKAVDKIKNLIDLELTIAGDGILKDDYMKLSESLELESCITFTGERSQKEVERILDQSDIFILPSFPEAFGVVLIEALAKGIPVITCKGNGGGEELKMLDYPVVLVTPGSHDELADAILNLSKDKNKLIEMSEIGKEIVRNNFTWENNGRSSFEFLEKSLKHVMVDN